MSVEINKFKNGLTVVSGHIPGAKIFNLNIGVRFGVRDQKIDEVEYSHLLEHLMMGDSRDTVKTLEQAGSHVNAHVSSESITLSGDALTEYGADLVNILWDRLMHPQMTDELISKEISTLHNEYRGQENNLDKYLGKILISLIYPQSGLVLRPDLEQYPLSTVSVLKLKKFHSQILHPELMFVVGVGDLNKVNIKDLIAKTLSDLPVLKLKKTRIKPQLGQVKFYEVIPPRSKKVTNFRFGWQTVPMADNLSPVFDLITSYLARGFDSKLFVEMRLKYNLIYSHVASSWSISDAGVFYFGFATTQPKKAEQVVMNDLTSWLESVDEVQLEKIKTKVINRTRMFVLSTQKNQAQIYTDILIATGGVQTLDDYIKKINQITLADFKQASSMLSLNNMYVLKG